MTKYYDDNATNFISSTANVDMEPIYKEFLPLLSGTKILDAGCGSARDSREFHSRGYNVTAFDASQGVFNLIKNQYSFPILHMKFSDMSWEREFDGIWACASLLHIPSNDLQATFDRLSSALKDNGILYCSFKYGTEEANIEGRHFTNLDETLFNQIINNTADLHTKKMWITTDQRPSIETKWLNSICQKHL